MEPVLSRIDLLELELLKTQFLVQLLSRKTKTNITDREFLECEQKAKSLILKRKYE